MRSQLGRFGPQSGMAELVTVWRGVVGEAIAQNAWPARIGRGAVLHVAVSSSAWAFELTHLETELLSRLEDVLGKSAPARLKFAVGPLPELPVATGEEEPAQAPAPSPAAVSQGEQLAAPIEDEELRKLVARAAAASLSKAESDHPFW